MIGQFLVDREGIVRWANIEGANFRGAIGVSQIQGLDQARNRDKAIFDEK